MQVNPVLPSGEGPSAMPSDSRPPDASPSGTPPLTPALQVASRNAEAYPRARVAEAASSGAETRLAPHRLRLVAFATDAALVAIVFGLALAFDKLVGAPAVVLYLAAGITFIYYLGATTWLMGGQTAGKAACGLVVRRIDGTPPTRSWRGLLWAFGRHSVGYLVVDVLGLGTLLALVTPRRRCLHDLAFGSEVVMVAPARAGERASFGTRYRDYWERFDSRYDEIKRRYRWFFTPWKWLTRVAVAVASYLTIVPRWASAAELSPPVWSAPPAKALSIKAGVAVWTTTTFTTAAIVAAVTPGPGPIPSDGVVAAVARGGLETSEIYLVGVDDGRWRQLTDNGEWDADPDLFADQEIVFISGRDGNPEIYVMGVDDDDVVRLTDDPARDYCPDWSPDGTRIAWTSDRDDMDNIYVMNADGSDQRRITDEPGAHCPDWSPDGTQLTFTSDRNGNSDVYVMNGDGTVLTQLTTHPGDEAGPAWSPDGRRIAFASSRDGNWNIYVIGSDGSGERRLTDDPAHDVDPSWASDGTEILFWSGRHLLGRAGELYAMNPDGTSQAKVTDTPAAAGTREIRP